MTQPDLPDANAAVEPVAPLTGPIVIPPVDLGDSSWWTWAATTAISLAVGIATLLGHPFNSAAVTALVPSFALIAVTVVTSFHLVGLHKARAQRESIAYDAHLKNLALATLTGTEGSFRTVAGVTSPSEATTGAQQRMILLGHAA